MYFCFHKSSLDARYLSSEQTQLTFAISTPESDSRILSLSSVGSCIKQGGTWRPAFSHKSISSGNEIPSFIFLQNSKTCFSGSTLAISLFSAMVATTAPQFAHTTFKNGTSLSSSMSTECTIVPLTKDP
ncbi:hypothetical protein HanXRQr2_Chr16g0728301 [Helianthus annuus]|uniref:Uncharacterized protein n=1 Tax=Helianthus annuus TaxID=4232 RepID=A0A9K3DQ77_HELAN|nr:hypothetical protein HanXRQr2_Chr16g0728301 [Helianthus annuus]